VAYPIPSITRMTFSDDFKSFSNSPDGSNATWMTSYPYGGDAARTLAGNNEQQYYSDSSVGANPFSVSNGVLSITASPGSNPAGLPYNSGVITTDNSFSQTYGYFETRAELPAGQGLWPAFWMLPSSIVYSSELDIFEVLEARPSNVISTLHGWYGDTWAQNASYYNGGDTSTGFHTYGVDWEPDTTTFYMDGNAMASAPTPTSMNDPMFMILNLAVGGNGSWSGPPDASTVFPATMQIDYVHAYATAGTKFVGGPAAINSGTSAPATSTPATSTVTPTGPDTLVLSVSEDAWKGDAQFTVSVDGVSTGVTYTATASHGAGATQAITINGNWGASAKAVSVNFVNDAYGGSGSTDRNFYIDSVNYDGRQISDSTAPLYSNGTRTFALAATSPSIIVLHTAEDAYLGDAQFNVAIDGNPVGGTLTETASNASGASTAVTLNAALTSGWHDLALSFLNDAYGGPGAGLDRNLYLKGAEINGVSIPSASVALYSNNTGHVSFFVPQT
jgi:beta-glucanase (GH16 family)